MPALSPTMSQGNLTSWKVKVGDEVAPGTVLAEIETDKATLEWENQDDGFIAKLLQEDGARDLAVGTPLAVLVEEEESVSAFADYRPSSSGGQESQREQQQQQDQAQPSTTGSEAKQEPAKPKVQANSRIGPAARLLLEHSGLSANDIDPTGPNSIITKSDVLKAIESGSKPSTSAKPQEAKQSQPQPQEKPQPSKAEPAAPSKSDDSSSRAKSDESSQQPQQKPAGKQQPYTDVPNSQIRKIIAQRLLDSKQKIPHLYVRADADIGKLTEMRSSLKEQGMKLSVNDFIVRAVALALKQVPNANAAWDDKAEQVRAGASVDVAIAVATDKGLITPIVKAADTKSLQQISKEVKELASRARANKLKPDEFQGGTFSISNLGMFGVDFFSAIINPPQACIMAVGGTRKRVIMQQGALAEKQFITVSLSADNRVWDGETSSAFLNAFCSNIQNPVKLLL
ncbi:hypothetical protein WJX73_002559 [Symbiochloris irregularis]|uniref:Dihydrolipoamide acetyltransferase component of pyruvate dehydrogenase complex n=1 Tax=Symbiochloris irregularis TaxID=706552 RepID=A0AAW1PZX6_9CHLO